MNEICQSNFKKKIKQAIGKISSTEGNTGRFARNAIP